MSHTLYNKVKYLPPMEGLGFGEKAILFLLADASHDSETVFMRVSLLARIAACSERTAQRHLRQLERLHLLLPQGNKQGRGCVNAYKFNLDAAKAAEEESTPPTEDPPASQTDELPSPNGHSSASSYVNPPNFWEEVAAETKNQKR